MSRRLVLDATGLRIAKPGFDAATAAEADLLFSNVTRQLMQVDAGRIPSLGDPTWVPFSVPLAEPPLVIVTMEGRTNSTGFPVAAETYANGFNARAGLETITNTYPAIGQPCSWVAFMLPRQV